MPRPWLQLLVALLAVFFGVSSVVQSRGRLWAWIFLVLLILGAILSVWRAVRDRSRLANLKAGHPWPGWPDRSSR